MSKTKIIHNESLVFGKILSYIEDRFDDSAKLVFFTNMPN